MADTGKRGARISLVIFDVDGVFTDARLYLGASGEELKAFHVRDGVGVKSLLTAGVHIAILSGRSSAAVARRMEELGVRHVRQGCADKLAAFVELTTQLGIAPEETACVGDDTPDLKIMRAAGLAIAVADAHPEVLALADWTTTLPGGHGAVREVCDLIVAARSSHAGERGEQA